LQIDWSYDVGAPLQLPVIYQGGISYTPQPDTTEGRVTNWDIQGRLSDKLVKGVLIECDTGDVEKTIAIQADGSTKEHIKVRAAGRKVLQFSFPQFQGRILRFYPTDTVQWMLYRFKWIFDEEPLSLLRWESQELDHGFQGWKTPLFMQVTLRSNQAVVLTVRTYRQDGNFLDRLYTIPSTGGIKQMRFVPFKATKGVLFKYLWNAGDDPFWLYREETKLTIQPWGGSQHIEVKPFGSDDLDLVRSMVDAESAAARPGLANR
jgi:hypothetical protein